MKMALVGEALSIPSWKLEVGRVVVVGVLLIVDCCAADMQHLWATANLILAATFSCRTVSFPLESCQSWATESRQLPLTLLRIDTVNIFWGDWVPAYAFSHPLPLHSVSCGLPFLLSMAPIQQQQAAELHFMWIKNDWEKSLTIHTVTTLLAATDHWRHSHLTAFSAWLQ